MTLRFQHKLSIPAPAFSLIERPYLLEHLEQTIATKQVVALAALAGWGKTTALAQWAQHTKLPVAWYTLDTTDRDPREFLDYVLAAVERHVPGATELLQRLDGTLPQALPELFRQAALVVAATPRPFALVLDDYHILEDENMPLLPGIELIFEFLARIAEYALNCHLILVSRTLPNLQGLARLVAQRRAVFFDYSVLQWNADDVQQLALSTGASQFTATDAEQLATQMSGWVTGIILLLDHGMHGQQPIIDLVADTWHVYAYFAEQIIAPLRPDILRFLEDTSILEDLSPQRCNVLRNAHDSGTYLTEVTRRGLFISQKGSWLSYHSLFRDFLRARLAHDPVRERILLLRAAELYRDEDDVERALECYLAARAEDDAITLLRDRIPVMRQRSRQNTLLACFERLAAYFEQAGRGRILPPDLLLAQVRVYGDLVLWERAALALRLAETVGDTQVGLEATILSAELLLLQGQAVQAQSVLQQIPYTNLSLRLQLEYCLTLGRGQILTGATAQAIAALESAYTLAPQVVALAQLPVQLAAIADNLGWAYAMQGNHTAALRHLKRADACWQASGNQGRRAMTLNNLGMIALEEGLLAEARGAFSTGLVVAHETARYREELYLQHSLAELEISAGNFDLARNLFQSAYELAVRIEVPASAATSAAGALWAAALAGHSETVQHWLTVLLPLAEHSMLVVQVRQVFVEALSGRIILQRDLAALEALCSEGEALAQFLTPTERAYLSLLYVLAAYTSGGWDAASSLWSSFEQTVVSLPEAILRRFALAHPVIFQAAAEQSILARRIIATIDRPLQVRWNISVLGQFACLIGGAMCELSPLHRTILVRLLDAGEAGLTVERLWEEVWGDSDIRMSALHKALFRLREQTGLSMAARAGHCAIQTPWNSIQYDAQLFERAIATANTPVEFEQALALYHGDFLPGAALSAALWVDRRRLQLQQQYLDGLERLSHILEENDPRQSIQLYQQILAIDGCREETAARLMRLAARQRNHALVSATFEQLTGALRTLGAAPEPATVALLHSTIRPQSAFERIA